MVKRAAGKSSQGPVSTFALTMVRVLSGDLCFGCIQGEMDGSLVTVLLCEKRGDRCSPLQICSHFPFPHNHAVAASPTRCLSCEHPHNTVRPLPTRRPHPAGSLVDGLGRVMSWGACNCITLYTRCGTLDPSWPSLPPLPPDLAM